jgi:hypothetical protein
MGNENPYTGVGRMNVCNYLSNIALLGGLAGEKIYPEDIFKWHFLLLSYQDWVRIIRVNLEKSGEKFEVNGLEFTRLVYGDGITEILSYYYGYVNQQYVIKIIFLGEKIILR